MTGRRIALLLVAALVVGALARGLLPPFVLDDPFWREFWSGPPAAGVFALLGAGVAFVAAHAAARTARRSAQRQEWWDRAQWALDLARSDDGVDRIIGLRAIEAMEADATEVELAMIVAVVDSVTGDREDVDNTTDLADDGGPGGDRDG